MGLDPFVGEITMFAGNFPPRGWAFCDGQLLDIGQNETLFSILGTTYGGDGRRTFGLPDLRGRAPVHAGTGPGLTPRALGARGGSETVTLSVNELPSHTHEASATARCAGVAGTHDSPAGKVWSGSSEGDQGYSDGAPDSDMAGGAVEVAVAASGGGQAHDNVPPFQAVHFIIALTGIYPNRA